MSDTFERNYERLRTRWPELAERLGAVEPSEALVVEPSKQPGYLTGAVAVSDGAGGARRITLASRHRPSDEARRFAEQADVTDRAAVVCMGVGLGHHVRELAKRLAGKSLLVVYEPDTALLRSVLETIDADWLGAPHVELMCDEPDVSTITRRLETYAPQIAQGVQVLTHAPTRQMHGERMNVFADRFTQFVAYCRTNVATSMVIALQTCRNYANNLGRYAAGASLNELKDAAAGRPAVLVAAGPSLARNIHLLEDPQLRQRVVIIAAQTALKPLLARGIKPHFVTALDYHPISQRFYDGLPELPDVTLVAEPKVNSAVVDHYPGPVRFCRAGFIDTLLGELGKPMDALPAGSTVAHLSLYLAQYLGCDPIVLTGQDLGFTDGLYYMPGTAIHEVWSAELNPFNSLEMLEWQRIARHKAHLRKLDDVNGRPIYTDEQMLTYLRQFERDFGNAAQTIIDATEGGLPKAHTTRMALSEALAAHAGELCEPLPTPPRRLDHERLRLVSLHLQRRVDEVRQLMQTSRQTLPILREMVEQQRDLHRMGKLFKKLEANKRRVAELNEAFGLVNELNQIGAFNRLRADRAIQVNDELDDYARQKAQLERDTANVKWLIEACELVLEMFGESAARLEVLADEHEPPMGAVA